MAPVSESTFLCIVRTNAWYGLIVIAPLATPRVFALLHQTLSALAHTLGMGGLPAFEPTYLLMANLMGSVVRVWSVLRIRRLSVALGRYDAMTRKPFAAQQAHALTSGAISPLVPFLTTEISFGPPQSLPAGRLLVRAGARAT